MRKIIFGTAVTVFFVFLFAHIKSTAQSTLLDLSALRELGENSGRTVKSKFPALNNSQAPVNPIQITLPLAQLLREDRLCEIIRERRSTKETVLALLEAPDIYRNAPEEDQVIGILFGKDSPMSVNPDSQNVSSETLEFYNALLYSGLLYGVFSQQFDLDRSNQLLMGLSRRNNGNGAFAYFDAAVLEKGSAPRPELKQKFLDAFSKPIFNTYYTSIGRRLREKGLANASYFLISIELASSMPVPNYDISYRLLKTFLHENESDFNQQAIAFAQRLMQPGLDAQGKGELYSWSALEYALGVNIMKDAWKGAYPEKPLPEMKTYRDVMGQVPMDQEFISALDGLNAGVCNRDKLDQIFPKEMNRLLKLFRQLK